MSGGQPPKKKPKQASLGVWLVKPDANTRGRQGSSGGQGSGSGTAGAAGAGSGGQDPWAKYQAPRGGNRAGAPAGKTAQQQQPPRPAPYNAYNKHGGGQPPRSHGAPVAGIASMPARNAWGQAYGGGGAAGGRAGGRAAAAPTVIDVEDSDDGVGLAGRAGGVVRQEAGVGAGTGAPEGVDDILEGLCDEQRHVIDLVLKGKSVFFTGAAGTGKSFLLKKLHEALRRAGKGPSTFMTGTTGKAAVGIGGCTVHSFAGIGLGNQPVDELLARVQRTRSAQKRWAECSVLVIDEISMMEADLFDKLNLVGQRMKGNPQPFGGIQLVLCGDFFQLPPVGIGRGTTRFCFEAKTWDTSVDQSIVLKQVFRQKDPFFLKILHEMREGRVGDEAQRILMKKVDEGRRRESSTSHGGGNDGGGGGGEADAIEVDGEGGVSRGGGGGTKGVTYTRLYSKNEDVDRVNTQELRKLDGRAEFYDAQDSGDPTYLRQLQTHCAATARVELKVGAKVLLLKNLDSSSQLVNGATGVVTEFVEASGRVLPKVEFDAVDGVGKVVTVIREEEWTITLGEKEMARRVQLPLRLAWALSVHKSQGMTIANVMVSTHGMFEYGQAYVALSRATTLDGLRLLDFSVGVVRAHHTVKAFYAALEMRALGGSSRNVTAVMRQGPAVPTPGEWISRMPRPSPAQGSSSPSGARVSTGGEGDGGGISPAARQRMAENRRRALEKLAQKRSKALQESSPVGRLGGNGGSW